MAGWPTRLKLEVLAMAGWPLRLQKFPEKMAEWHLMRWKIIVSQPLKNKKYGK